MVVFNMGMSSLMYVSLGDTCDASLEEQLLTCWVASVVSTIHQGGLEQLYLSSVVQEKISYNICK